ncbi:dipeptide ABC transporter ATP-binding protein [Nocardia aurantiaca]|uniref:Dipeptide ABC transporter ATP-binding protein n=1 Tax=Nocardia aurantiaca TaxID=2675850 RepID=A0A6I3L1W2_9NOCA|nr:ABC transporter ATP-binding protein [Nocardia aurantiaca]MTE15691.1 dipeptide ABC transporter ATP-binding protein [Nocardia aurantiaca]
MTVAHAPAALEADTVGAPVLAVENLTVGYRVGRGYRPVVQGVSFELPPGQVLALVGESGSGKTTTAHAILGLLPDNGAVIGGRIMFRDRVITGLSPKGWRDIRGRAVSLIPQDPGLSLDPVRRVGPQVEDVLLLHTDLDADARRRRVHELFELVGFTDVDHRYRQYPHELSGGMRQRVLIAAAVAAQPDLIIADEPTSALDATVQKQVLDLIDDLRGRSGTSVVLVTHDLGVAADRSDLLAVMRDGQLVEFGSTKQIVAQPQHEYTRRLLDAVPTRSIRARTRAAVAEAGETVIEITELRKEYGGAAAVDGISLRVRGGETFSLVGESGSGKTTTARVIAGLTEATSGQVTLLGADVTGLGRKGFRPLRREVQIVYQNPYSSFDPRFDVYDVVDEPLRSFQPRRGLRRVRRPNAERVVAALEAAALPADFIDRHPGELSGGQRQRVAIARALILEPKVLILDEPISALDVSVAAQILDLLRGLQEERGLTYLFISHDLAVVRAISDRVAVMRRGRIVEQGPVDDVFTRPVDDYTISLLDAIAGRTLPGGLS